MKKSRSLKKPEMIRRNQTGISLFDFEAEKICSAVLNLTKRDPDFDSKENTFPGSNRNDSESTICPEKYKLSTKVEVESIEDIIRKAKENFKDSQSEIMVKYLLSD